MIRYFAVLVGMMYLLPATAATVTTKQTSSSKDAKAQKGPERATQPTPDADFAITTISEVKLNGRRCRFKDVPNHAVITKIVVDPDTKAILLIHFSTGK